MFASSRDNTVATSDVPAGRARAPRRRLPFVAEEEVTVPARGGGAWNIVLVVAVVAAVA
ncbi:MAG: hypothetical protein M3O70_08130 [Actinomycetota bacterium]|nr:hypothetical protein [Actinomycetota bacterium]